MWAYSDLGLLGQSLLIVGNCGSLVTSQWYRPDCCTQLILAETFHSH